MSLSPAITPNDLASNSSVLCWLWKSLAALCWWLHTFMAPFYIITQHYSSDEYFLGIPLWICQWSNFSCQIYQFGSPYIYDYLIPHTISWNTIPQMWEDYLSYLVIHGTKVHSFIFSTLILLKIAPYPKSFLQRKVFPDFFFSISPALGLCRSRLPQGHPVYLLIG